MINDYNEEKECEYKGEVYSVRDNGSVMRHARPGMNPRPNDNIWTFGRYSKKTGYAEISGERVHRIVATAFYGPAPTPQHVVDHIDTNRRNNRPENLRWVTKLENIIMNPITCKKITMLCGSIEAFLANPTILREQYVDRDFEWMRAVTKEEGAATLERMRSWAKSDKDFSGGSLGEWVYKRDSRRKLIEIEQSFQDKQETTKPEPVKTEEIATTILQEQEKPIQKIDKANPFNFSRSEGTLLYRTASELINIFIAKLKSTDIIKLPNIFLETSGKGLPIRDSWDEEIEDISYVTEGKSRIPKSILVHGKENDFAIVIKTKSVADQNEIDRLTNNGCNILELDLSWAKNGLTESEIESILRTDITKKGWLRHSLIFQAKEKLSMICEPICEVGSGVAHHYNACPITSDSIQDIECWYCNYRTIAKLDIDGELEDCECCFAKSGVKTYEDLNSIINVEKDGMWIVEISYLKNGEVVTKKFDKFVKLPGDTILNLWAKRTTDYIVVHNIYSGWYVLIDEDPQKSLEKSGKVFGRLARTLDDFENISSRSIFSYDDYCWELI